MEPIRVLLDCNSKLLWEALAGLLQPPQEFECLEAASAGPEPDVIVAVLPSDHSGGLQSIARNLLEHSQAPILALSLSTDLAGGVDCLRAGASGFLTADTCRSEFVHVVRYLAAGGRFISGALAAFLVDRAQRPTLASRPELSSRELQVMKGYATGKGSKAIASELNVSIKTVSTYRNRLLDKLGLRNNADLVLYAFQHGFPQANGDSSSRAAAAR